MILLASQSPRRAELLNQLKVDFETIKIDVDESILEGEGPEAYVTRLAMKKAQVGWEQSAKNHAVLGSDTAVVIDQNILGKPKDFEDSKRMLTSLSGRTHQVLTAVALVKEQTVLHKLVVTKVTFKELSDEEIEDYWETGEPQDKAGSYGIQGLAGHFVKQIQGSYSAVVGLPLYETNELVKEMKGLKFK